jgi:hypothetical protein
MKHIPYKHYPYNTLVPDTQIQQYLLILARQKYAQLHFLLAPQLKENTGVL